LACFFSKNEVSYQVKTANKKKAGGSLSSSQASTTVPFAYFFFAVFFAVAFFAAGFFAAAFLVAIKFHPLSFPDLIGEI
jgi:hypothetical protein